MGPRHEVQSPTSGPRQHTPVAGRAASTGIRLHALALTVGLIVVTLVVGWLVWAVIEWRRSATPSFRMTGLTVVSSADRAPAGFARMLLREVLCAVLILPTVVAGCVLGIVFVMGASPPDDLFRRPRRTPWDFLSGTDVREVHEAYRFAALALAPPSKLRQN